MNDLSKRIAALSPEQRAFFEQQLKKRGLSAPTVQVIPRRPAMDEIPLSFGQQRLWFLDQFDPGSPAYNGPSAVRLSGPLDVGALERSLNEVVRRHEALRTTFTQVADGHPVQVIADRLEIHLPIHDLRAYPADTSLPEPERTAAREAEALRLAVIEFQRTFDLERGPLVRAQLLRLAETEYILLFTVHHIVSDGWSTELLIAEVTTLYAVFAAGQPAEAARLPEPAVQYPDFAVWQREYLQGAVLESQLAYWRERLANAPELLELPTDRPRPAVQSYRGAVTAFSLERSLAHALAELARREGVTLFMVLLAAFDLLLQRWSGQDDLIVGTMVSGRGRSELNNVMGFFANNLALRTSLAGDPTFREVIQRVRATALEAFSHQDVPFELLVEKLNPNRSRSHAPIFQVIFTLQNEQVPAREVGGVTTRPMLIDNGTSKLDLFMFMWEGQDRLTGTLEYSTDLFDQATIDRLIGEFTVLLGGIVADPNRRIAALPLLTEAEHALLRDWNATGQLFAETRPIHDLVAAQAARTPDQIAVVCGKRRLTYRELNEQANQLAHALRGLGVGADSGRESLVGLCVERSLDMVVAVLGILKAGGAYVPLDPAYPAERLAFIAQDTQMAVLLAHAPTRAALPPSDARIVCLDADRAWIVQAPVDDLDLPVRPGQLAYVLHTSGSTGRPKGVQIPHAALTNFLHSMRQRPGLSERDVLLSVTSLSFDIAGLEIFLPLMAGARLVLAPREIAADGEQLAALWGASGATFMQATPATWRLLLAAGWRGLPGQTLLCGGDTLPADLATQLVSGGASLWNMYGPTETTIWSTLHPVAQDDAQVSIGRPIANTEVYLLDDAMQPVPIGVTGHLYIGGAGVARGYLNRPDLTAERFVPNPFERLEIRDWRLSDTESPISNLQSLISMGTRLYKTGDLARFLPNGDLIFLGRSDNQVKLRGFRIELGEIEAVLGQHPDLSQAAVVVRDQHLVAYIVPSQEQRTKPALSGGEGNKEQNSSQEPRTENQEPAAEDGGWKIGDGIRDGSGQPSSILYPPSSDLRAFLKERLPEYMIPAVFVPLKELPLTPNGKLDRRALPDASGARPSLEQAYVAPRTPTEAVLTLIWAEVLEVDRVGVFDNFFELGGHSLRAILLLARVRAAFQISLPLQKMFESASVAALAALLVEHETQPGRTDKIARLLQRIKGASDSELQTNLEQHRTKNQEPRTALEKGEFEGPPLKK